MKTTREIIIAWQNLHNFKIKKKYSLFPYEIYETKKWFSEKEIRKAIDKVCWDESGKGNIILVPSELLKELFGE